jgi:hypothetical protein
MERLAMMLKRLAASAVARMRALAKTDMCVTRVVAGLTAVATAVLGLNLVTAGPAAAATYVGTWRAYGNTSPIHGPSQWACGVTGNIEPDGSVIGQVCVIRTADRTGVQVAVIVRNNRNGLYGVNAAARMWDYDYGEPMDRWECARSGVAPHSWSVCFGQTIRFQYLVWASGGANGQALPDSWIV